MYRYHYSSSTRRRRRPRRTTPHSLHPPQIILVKILKDQKELLLDLNKIYVGINKGPIESNEIPFSQLNSNDSNISVQNIIYLKLKTKHIRTGVEKNILLYDRKSGIDRITCSGNTQQLNMWTTIRHLYIDRKILQQHNNSNITTTKGMIINESDDEKHEINNNDEKQDVIKLVTDSPTVTSSISTQTLLAVSKDTLSILKRGFYKMYYATAYDENGESKQRFEKLKQQYKQTILNYNVNEYEDIDPQSQQRQDEKLNVEDQIIIEHKMVIIDDLLQNTIKHSVLYHHNDDYKFLTNDCDEWLQYNKYDTMKIEIVNENVMCAMNMLNKDNNILNPIVLHFAAPMLIGKGFLKGNCQQEDVLLRCTGLYNILKKFETKYHHFHKQYCKNNFLFSHSVIYAPNVPIFRDYNCNLLRELNRCSIISASAVNAKYYLKRYCGDNMQYMQEAKKIIYDTMNERIDKILDIAVRHGHDGIILGGFGCYSFENDANMIADIFATLLSTKYKSRFKSVRFSIYKEELKNKMIFNAFHYAMKRRFNL